MLVCQGSVICHNTVEDREVHKINESASVLIENIKSNLQNDNKYMYVWLNGKVYTVHFMHDDNISTSFFFVRN